MRDEALVRDNLALLLGGFAGAVWCLVFFADVAAADDCLQYVRRVQNFVKIPKGLLEDCMRTGSVQAIITAVLGGMGGGAIAIGVGKGLQEGARLAGSGPHIGPETGVHETPEPTPVWENDYCTNCGAELPRPVTPGGRCPSCAYKNPVTNIGLCPGCGGRINLDWGECPACKATFEPPPIVPPPEDGPGEKPKDPNLVFENDKCSVCGRDLPHPAPADGRCPACGVRNTTTSVGPCPKCGKVINLDYGDCPACGTLIAAPPKPGQSSASFDVQAPPARDAGSGTTAPLAKVRIRIEQIDSARAAYDIAKAMMSAEDALRAAENLARDLGMDPEDARKLLELDDNTWAQQKFWALNSQNPAL